MEQKNVITHAYDAIYKKFFNNPLMVESLYKILSPRTYRFILILQRWNAAMIPTFLTNFKSVVMILCGVYSYKILMTASPC